MSSKGLNFFGEKADASNGRIYPHVRTFRLRRSQRFFSMEEAMEHFRHQYRITTAEQETIVWDHLGWVLKVENALMSHPALMECAVTGAADPLRGQVVKTTVVLTGVYQPSDDLKLELQNHVKKVTAPYKYPRIIEFVEALPKTISGKIRRVEIREKDDSKTE